MRVIAALLLCLILLSSSALSQAIAADPTYYWKNFNELPAEAQAVWVDVLTDEVNWDFCYYPPHFIADGTLVEAIFCKFFEGDRFILQWVKVIAEVAPDCGIFCSNLVYMSYGRYGLFFMLWEWKWTRGVTE